MAKLHELIAVEPTLRQKAQKALENAVLIFTRGSSRFTGQVRTYEPLEDNGEKLPDESANVAEDAASILADSLEAFGTWLEVSVQKEQTNSSGVAVADVKIGENVLLKGMSATALLNLEGKLDDIRKLLDAVPTLDTATEWTFDENRSLYRSPAKVTYRTAKVPKAHVLYEATKEHPAQVEQYFVDIQVGKWNMVALSSAIPVKVKRDRLSRLDRVILAVKEARQRANDVQVSADSGKVASTIFSYVLGGK